MKTFPYGTCQCPTGMAGGCCGGHGPAAFEVERDGKTIRVCTKCDLSSDKNKVLLVKESDDKKIFIKHDAWAIIAFGSRGI